MSSPQHLKKLIRSLDDVKPDAPRPQPMLFTNQAAETPLDNASAHANYHISGLQSPS
jgi:hypothetical protein